MDDLIKDLDMLEKDETFSSSEFNSGEDGDVDQQSQRQPVKQQAAAAAVQE